jgi:hypothetical protein
MARRLVLLLSYGVLGAIGALLFEGLMLGRNSEADKDLHAASKLFGLSHREFSLSSPSFQMDK